MPLCQNLPNHQENANETETYISPAQEPKTESSKVPEFRDLLSANDEVLAVISSSENPNNSKAYARNKVLGAYLVLKKMDFKDKIDLNDHIAGTNAFGTVYENKSYGYYIVNKNSNK